MEYQYPQEEEAEYNIQYHTRVSNQQTTPTIITYQQYRRCSHLLILFVCNDDSENEDKKR